MDVRKIVVTLIATMVCLSPTMLFLLASVVLEPDGFWQKLVLVTIGVWMLGALQAFLLLCWCIIIVYLIWSD